VAEDAVPSMVLAGIAASMLSVSSVGIAGTMMFRNVSCKWSHNNGSCIDRNCNNDKCISMVGI
jgi:hypothetical protein